MKLPAIKRPAKRQTGNCRLSSQSSSLVMSAGLVIALLVAFASFLAQQAFLFGFSLSILLLCLCSRAWGFKALEHLEIHISAPQKRIFAGDQIQFGYRVDNKKFLPLIWLEVGHRLPKNGCMAPLDESAVRAIPLPADEEENLRAEYERLQAEEAKKDEPQIVPPPDYTCMAFCRKCSFLLWHQSMEWDAVWAAKKRGIFQAAQVLLHSGDGFGLSETESAQMAVERPVLLVYPKLVPVRPEPFLQNVWDARSGAKGYMEDCTIIQGERDYQPTDSWKRIDWRMAARRSPLQVKVFETILPKSVHFLLDASSFLLPEQRMEDALEDVISVLASLAVSLDGSQVWCGLTLPATPSAAQYDQLPNGEGPDTLLAALASFDSSGEVFRLEPGGLPRDQVGQICIFTYSLASPGLFHILDTLGDNGLTIVPYLNEGAAPDYCRVLPLDSLRRGDPRG